MNTRAREGTPAGREFPSSLPSADREKWETITPQQRDRITAKLRAIEEWRKGELTLDAAVALSGLSRSRFYRVAAEWRAAPSLAVLGASAGVGVAARERLDPVAINALQSVVPRVVALNADASVSRLVRLMVEASGITERLPGTVRLRALVEAELRRVATTGEAGNAVQFDCTAINLPLSGERPWVMFACVDAGSGLILGAAVAPDASTEQGYRRAARDALERIDGPLKNLPWALRLARIEMTAGTDVESAFAIRDKLVDRGFKGARIASAEKRFGRYFRQVAGDRIGRVAITPARTETGVPMPDNAVMTIWSETEAAAAVAAAVDAHNGATLSRLNRNGAGCVPEDLRMALEMLVAD